MYRQEFATLLMEVAQKEGCTSIAENLNVYRFNHPTPRTHGFFTASICVVAQGAKKLELSGQIFRYDPDNFVIASLDVPMIGEVIEASPDKPFVCLKMEFDPITLASVCVESGIIPARNESSVKSVAVGKLTYELQDAFLRLAMLFRHKDDFRMISPLVIREIIYRLLKSEQGPRIRQLANFGEQTHRITKAVQIIQERFKEPLRIEQLAGQLNMSASSFHEHFKTTTSMSPLQFQKALRLQEARRLLLAEKCDAGAAASLVGYEDPSQFSREYKRLFGVSPKTDKERFNVLARP